MAEDLIPAENTTTLPSGNIGLAGAISSIQFHYLFALRQTWVKTQNQPFTNFQPTQIYTDCQVFYLHLFRLNDNIIIWCLLT